MSLVTVDQGLSSASNLGVVIIAAHGLSASDFGRFSLILLIYAFALGPTRAVISLPALIFPEDADRRPWSVLGSALVLDLWAGVFCLALGAVLLLTESDMGPALLLLGALLPLLQLHDVARYLAIARAKPGGAILLDTTWLVLMAGAFILLWTSDRLSFFSFILAWGGTGALASALILFQYGLPGRRDLTLGWLRERWDLSWRSLVGNVTSTGGALVGASLISLVSSPVAVAAVRAALLLGRPSATVQAAVSSSTAADVARQVPDDARLRKHQRRAMAIAAAVALVNLVVLVALPDWLGTMILGNVWPLIDPLMLPIGLVVLAMAAQAGVRAALLGRRQMHVTMIADIVGAVLSIVSVVVGAMVADASGAVWGLVVGSALTSLCWWVAFEWYMRRARGLAPDPVGESLA